MTMAQTMWDVSDPSTFAGRIHNNRLPCGLGESVCPGGITPDHHIMTMIGQDDAQVANISSDFAARSMQIPVVTPSPYMPHGPHDDARGYERQRHRRDGHLRHPGHARAAPRDTQSAR